MGTFLFGVVFGVLVLGFRSQIVAGVKKVFGLDERVRRFLLAAAVLLAVIWSIYAIYAWWGGNAAGMAGLTWAAIGLAAAVGYAEVS